MTRPLRRIVVLAALGAGLVASRPIAQSRETPGTQRMAARLRDLADRRDPSVNPVLNLARAEQLQRRYDATTDMVRRLEIRIALGHELTLAGRTEEALGHLIAARDEVRPMDPTLRVVSRVSEMIAIAYLRLGEQENCIGGHNSESCLLPIRGNGIYKHDRATRFAIEEYTALLEGNPEDLTSRWLLNLAYMTLGEWPDKVPEAFRITPSTFASDYDLARFTDVAPRLGLALVGHAGGVIMDDFNGDRHLDLMISSWDLREQLRFFVNRGDGTFAERTAEAGLTGETGGLNLVQADYDNDGHQDVLVLRGAWLGMVGQGDHPSSLLRNRGDGTFDDVTEQAGLMRFRSTQTAGWADYDGDGWLDLFIGVESPNGRSVPSELYHNNGNGTFTEVAAQVGLGVTAFVKGITWGDYNNDSRPDLYVSIFGAPNRLFRNDGPAEAVQPPGTAGAHRWRFTDVTSQANVANPINSFATWFWDYDNDGWLDLFVAPFLGFNGKNMATVVAGYLGKPHSGETPRLYHNRRDGTFEDVTVASGLAHPMLVMGSNYGDVDGDGFLDAYLGTGEPDLTTLDPSLMFRNDEGRGFQDVTTSGGFGHLQKGHGIAFGDLDNDGDQDIYAVMGGAYEGDVYQNALFLNPGNGRHWVALHLTGTRSNRSAIGARIAVAIDTPSGARTVYGTVTSGGSFGASPLRQFLGLGNAVAIRSIEVRWPASGTVQRFQDVALDRLYGVREDAAALESLPVTRADFTGAASR